MPSGSPDSTSRRKRRAVSPITRRTVLKLTAGAGLSLAGVDDPAMARPRRLNDTDAHAATAAQASRRRQKALAAVRSWGIHLRYMDKARIASSPFDLIVVDYAPYRHLTFEFPYERADIAAMQAKPDGRRRLVLAYLSIGEAEDYRYYWDRNWPRDTRPPWVGPENPKWPGNFPARFWLPEWQRLIAFGPRSYLERIVAAGFDGIYIDRADVYDEWKAERPTSESDMVDFIATLATHARKANPDFLVVLQNAEELLSKRKARDAIDGFAKEDLVFGADAEGQRNKQEMIDYSLGVLARARRGGLPILVLEYLQDPAKIAEVRRTLAGARFLTHFAERSLNTLTLQAPDDGESAPSRPPPR